MKLKYPSLILCMIFLLMNAGYALNYKWTSTIPVEFVPLSSIDNQTQLEYYLNKHNIVVFYIDEKYSIKSNDWILYKFNITRVSPDKIPDYGNYTLVSSNGVVVLYPENSVYRDKDGALIYNTPMPVNDVEYKIQHVPPVKQEKNSIIPDYYDYVLINNGTFIIYPQKYITRDDDGAIIYNPPLEIKNDNIPIYNVSTKLIDAEKGVYEIKPKKILITHPINPDDKNILDFIGYYVSENNGTFAYINKVPPHYKHVLINGIVVQNAIPDKNGDYAVDVAGRKVKVDLRDDDLINKKIKTVKGLSEILNINATYISTGSENLKVIKKENPNKDELDALLNEYWFKKWYNDKYYHTYYNPSNIKNNYNVKDFDILAMSYYPIIYADKAPETFQNDPKGGYYPEVISYKGTDDIGYWEKGVKSDNKYYYYDKNEPHWNDNDKYVSNWYYEGKVVSLANESEMNDRYKYFNQWFVKNYGYAVSEGVDGLLLTSNDKNLVDAVFGKENNNISWKLAMDGKLSYVVIPDYKGVSKENNITIIKIPGLTNDLYGMHYIKEYYIPPKDEEFGVYVADIVEYNVSKIYMLKNNYTWICSFKNYADWVNNYMYSNIKIVNSTIIIAKSNNPIKITIYKKGTNITSPDLLKIPMEEYDKNSNKIILYCFSNGSSTIKLS